MAYQGAISLVFPIKSIFHCIMKKITYLILVLVAPLAFAQNPKADSLIRAHLEKSNSIGMVAGFSKGKERWTLSEGMADQEEGQPISATTKIRIASVIKMVTATAIMQLVEDGKVELDEKISSYLSDLPSHLSSITVRHLLNHSAGIRGYNSQKERRNFKQYPTLQDAFSIFRDDALEGTPGQQYSYSTYGYVVLGLVVEQASGQDFESYIQTKILKPLGMENTGIERYNALPDPMSEVYHKNSKGKVRKEKRSNISDRIPGGGFYSTVDDMLTFGQALMSGKLISKSSFQQMITDSGLKKEGNPYGLGMFLYGENPTYGNVVGHGGAQLGASTQLMLLPDIGAVTFVASNTSATGQDVFLLSVRYFELAAEL